MDPAWLPRVSIAIPAYNAEPWLGETLCSALAQTLGDLEIVVIDDGSSDGTRDVIESYSDPRVRAFDNPANLGQSGTWNRAISLCRAPLVKFLCADDTLHPTCLERMTAIFDRAPSVGMVFSRRAIVAEGPDAMEGEWREYETMFRRFGPLDDVNDGRRMFAACLESGFDDNWIGEPSNVMVRRSLFERLRGFHPHIRQPVDMELWMRLLFHADVGFVDDELATYRLVADSVTQRTMRQGNGWLDRVWLLESLRADPAIRSAYPQLDRLVWVERRRAGVALGRNLRRPGRLPARSRDIRTYIADRGAASSWPPPAAVSG
jgi:glycosyltransferase involved in cell wall biosynthesis